MSKLTDRILKLPVPNMREGCYLFVSGQKEPEDGYGSLRVKPLVSFVYIQDDTHAAEWMPPYGPVAVIHGCQADAPNATENWVFPFADSGGLSWSQMAVEEHGLPRAFNEGNWVLIFGVLSTWAKGAHAMHGYTNDEEED